QLIQDQLLDYKNEYYNLTTGIDGKAGKLMSFSYDVTYSENKSQVVGEIMELIPIQHLSQRAQLNLFIKKGLIANISYEYLYNSAVSGPSKIINFSDMGIKYQYKKTELRLEYNNVFNTKKYVTSYY